MTDGLEAAVTMFVQQTQSLIQVRKTILLDNLEEICPRFLY